MIGLTIAAIAAVVVKVVRKRRRTAQAPVEEA